MGWLFWGKDTRKRRLGILGKARGSTCDETLEELRLTRLFSNLRSRTGF